MCFKWKMSIRRRPALPFPFIVEISPPCGGFPLFSSVHILAKLERPYYVIILGESCKVLGKGDYDVEGCTSQLKFERFPALTPACPLVLCVCCGFTLVFFFLNVSIFTVWNNVHCLGSGLLLHRHKSYSLRLLYSKSTAIVQKCLGSRKTSARKPETMPGVLSWDSLHFGNYSYKLGPVGNEFNHKFWLVFNSGKILWWLY